MLTNVFILHTKFNPYPNHDVDYLGGGVVAAAGDDDIDKDGDTLVNVCNL